MLYSLSLIIDGMIVYAVLSALYTRRYPLLTPQQHANHGFYLSVLAFLLMLLHHAL